jgi:hypothetical protein
MNGAILSRREKRMATRETTNGNGKSDTKSRYWLSADLGLMGNYSRVYEWLDSLGAEECGPGLATITSTKTRDQLAAEIRRILKGAPRARVYIISMKQGGRFVVGGRKAAAWEGFAESSVIAVDES